MNVSQLEMHQRAEAFSEKYKNITSERSQAQNFWRDFFDIFGVNVTDIRIFEQQVKTLNGNLGYIDLFWRGKLIVEHKSEGKNLDSAFQQAHRIC